MKIFPSNRESGVILIMALWVIFFLSSMALVIGFYVRPQMGLAYKLKNKAESHYLAEAGVKRAMAVVRQDEEEKAEETENYSTLNQTWSAGKNTFKDIDLGDGVVSVAVQSADAPAAEIKYGMADEERKININTAEKEVIKNVLLNGAELTQESADEVAVSIVNWRGSDLKEGEECPDNDYYRTQSPSYVCKKADYEILDELLLVKGMTRELFEKIKDRITIFGSGAVNMNTADKITLQSLGLSGPLIDKIFQFRSGVDGIDSTSDDNAFKSAESMVNDLNKEEALTPEELDELTSIAGKGILGVSSDFFKGTSIGKLKINDQSSRIEFVINRSNEIKYWREE